MQRLRLGFWVQNFVCGNASFLISPARHWAGKIFWETRESRHIAKSRKKSCEVSDYGGEEQASHSCQLQ